MIEIATVVDPGTVSLAEQAVALNCCNPPILPPDPPIPLDAPFEPYF